MGQQVLRQVNTKRQLNRSDSLTKHEKTEMNLRAKAGEKYNTVALFREQFEGKHSRGYRMDVTKLRKKLSDCNNRRIKRRHTVGDTRDFSENVVSWIVRGVSAWDRQDHVMSDQIIGGCPSRWKRKGGSCCSRWSSPCELDLAMCLHVINARRSASNATVYKIYK